MAPEPLILKGTGVQEEAVLSVRGLSELLVELLGGKEEAEKEAWRLFLLIYGPLLKKGELISSLLSGIPLDRDITALKEPRAIIEALKKTRQKLWKEKYRNWFE